MATVITHLKGNKYEVLLYEPEAHWLSVIQEQLGMDKLSILAASLNKGLVYYVDMLREIDQHNAQEKLAGVNTKEVSGGETSKLFETDTTGDRKEH